MRAVTAVLFIACLAACGPQQAPAPVQLDVVVTDDAKSSLPDIPITIDGQVVGKTGSEGTHTLQVAPPQAGHLRLSIECPPDFRHASARALTVTSGQQLKVGFECRPKLRTLAVVVSAPQAEGLTVLADGEPIGRVGEDGTLHALLKRPPEAELRLMLDTTPVPLLHPQNPIEDLLVPDHDDIIVFNQALTMRTEPKRAAARARSKPAEHHIPYAIGRN